jgi:hypothetical protein
VRILPTERQRLLDGAVVNGQSGKPNRIPSQGVLQKLSAYRTKGLQAFDLPVPHGG